MALVKYGGFISRIQGKVGGSVFQESQGGSILRHLCPPVRRNTIRQQKPKLIADQSQVGWISLSEDQRATWEGWARYMRVHQRRNTELFISGHQAYLRVNQIRLQYSFPLLDDPVFNKCDPLPIDAELRVAGPNLFLDLNRNMVAMDQFIVLFITIPLPVTWNNPRGHLKLVEFVTTNGLTQNITSEVEALYGFAPTVGDTVFFKYTVVTLDSGHQFPYQTKKQTLT